MTIHADASEQLVIHDKENNQLMFRNGYLVKVKDKNGNTLVVAWNEGRVISVTDGAGRKTVLTYLKTVRASLPIFMRSLHLPEKRSCSGTTMEIW